MDIKEIKQNFNQTELLVIKKFLKYVNDTRQTDSDFADDASLDELNQFSDLSNTDEGIKASVKEYLRLKKVRLRGNFTNN
jgi:dsDNA-specific endonuclease/ATPase MutS2